MGEAKRKREAGIVPTPRMLPRCACGWAFPSAFGMAATSPEFVFTPLLIEQLQQLTIQFQCPKCKAVRGVQLQVNQSAATPPPDKAEEPELELRHEDPAQPLGMPKDSKDSVRDIIAGVENVSDT